MHPLAGLLAREEISIVKSAARRRKIDGGPTLLIRNGGKRSEYEQPIGGGTREIRNSWHGRAILAALTFHRARYIRQGGNIDRYELRTRVECRRVLVRDRERERNAYMDG